MCVLRSTASSAAMARTFQIHGVYKLVLPREEATIVWDYQTLSPNLGLNSWAAFKPGIHDQAMLTGELLLLDDEVDSVISAAIAAGLDVTGLGSSSIFNGPHLDALDINATGSFRTSPQAIENAWMKSST